MCFNMFPGVNGIFHFLAPNQKVCDKAIISEIFDLAGREGIRIPIFRNDKGDTPMDTCLRPRPKEPTLEEPFPKPPKMNKMLAGLLFEKTKDYPLLHSSHTMNRAVYTAMAYRIPEVIDYIRARMIKSDQLSVE